MNDSPPGGAAPMRRAHDRRNRGSVLAQFEVAANAIGALVERGWLDPGKRGDHNAVTGALIGVLGTALDLAGSRPEAEPAPLPKLPALEIIYDSRAPPYADLAPPVGAQRPLAREADPPRSRGELEVIQGPRPARQHRRFS